MGMDFQPPETVGQGGKARFPGAEGVPGPFPPLLKDPVFSRGAPRHPRKCPFRIVILWGFIVYFILPKGGLSCRKNETPLFRRARATENPDSKPGEPNPRCPIATRFICRHTGGPSAPMPEPVPSVGGRIGAQGLRPSAKPPLTV